MKSQQGVLLALFAPTILKSNPVNAKGKRPNIIYVVVHDPGKHCEPYGVPVAAPHLQAFADQGVNCTNAVLYFTTL